MTALKGKKAFKVHFCIFSGRSENMSILMTYVSRLLDNMCIDVLHFIDFTHNINDHLKLNQLYHTYKKKYPEKVKLHNTKTRKKLLSDPDKIKATTGHWSPFYRLFDNFSDQDIIIKCDDDICYIDTNQFEVALQVRWKNRHIFALHSNCINNGVCAYHQYKQGIWPYDDLGQYPTGGLTGPLFIKPEIACKLHKKFLRDLQTTPENIERYKLNTNILFTNRVSINFIFLLGSDRHKIKEIDMHDEYKVSCEIPHLLNRPNAIVGEFITSHLSYGPQNNIVNKLKIREGYKQYSLKGIYYTQTTKKTHVNPTACIKYKNNDIIAGWLNSESYLLQDATTKMYMSLTTPMDKGHIPSLSMVKNIHDSVILQIDIHNTGEIFLNNSHFKLSTGTNIPPRLIPSFSSNKNETKGLKVVPTSFDTVAIRNDNKFLCAREYIDNKYSFMYSDTAYEWKLVSLSGYSKCIFFESGDPIRPVHIVTGDILPYNSIYDNTWFTKNKLWELQPVSGKEDLYNIKLVQDEHPPKYLTISACGKYPEIGSIAAWKVTASEIEHLITGTKLGIELSGLD